MMIAGFNWLDALIILILLIGAADGYAKGLIVSLFNIAGFYISLMITRYFSSPLTDFIISHVPVYNSINAAVTGRIKTLNPLTITTFKLFGLETDTAASVASRTIVNAISFIILFFTVLIVMNIIRDILKITVHSTSLKPIDKLGGIAFGFIGSVLFIFVVFAVATPFIGVFSKGTMIIDAIGTSRLAKYFYLYNFIIPWLEGLNKI
jgi:uncharacterized membrane protein required for colicin V production